MADSNKEVTIVIRGTNLSAEAFQKAREQLAGLKTKTDDAGKSGQTFWQQILGAKNATSLFSDQVKTLVAGFTIASLLDRGVGSLVGFAKSVFDTASRIGDLSSKLGTSAEFTQRMQYVAGQSGTTIEAFGTAIGKMNVLLSQGDASTVSALSKAGLSFTAIRAMRPEDAFYAITEAIRAIPDPMLQAELAVRLFGKGGQEILPAIKEGIRALGEQTRVMSDETVARLKRAQDSWRFFGDQAVIVTGEMIASLFHLDDVARGVVGSTNGFMLFMKGALHGNVAAGILDATLYQQAVDAMTSTLSAGEKQQVADMRAKGMTMDAIAKLYRTEVSGAIKAYVVELDKSTTQTGAHTQAQVKDTKAVDAHAAKIRELADTYTGKALARQITDTAEAFKLATREGGLNKTQTEALTKTLSGYIDDGAKLPPMLLSLWAAHQNFNTQVVPPTIKSFQDLMKSVGDYGQKIQTVIPPLAPTVAASMADILRSTSVKVIDVGPPLEKAKKEFKVTFDDILSGASMFANGVGGRFAEVANKAISLAGNVASMAMAFSKGDWISGSIQALGLLGTAVGKIFGSKGRDEVEKYVATFGGFDAFHTMLGKKLPADAERYWIALTQGVGKNDPEAAKRIIAEITLALDKQSKQEAATAQAAQDAAAAKIAAVDAVKQKILDQIKTLDQSRQSLMDSISNEAPEEVMGIVEAQTRAQIDAIDQQKAALQTQMDVTAAAGDVAVSQIKDSAREAYRQIKQEWENGLHIPVWYDARNSPNGGGAAPEQQYASGGIAEGRQMALIAERGRREIVGDESFMARAIKGANDRGTSITNNNNAGPVQVFVAVEQATGRVRQITREMWQELQQGVSGGLLSIPAAAIGRTR